MSKKKLFDDDSDEDIAIKTENEYAKKYDTWRKKEEIYKLEQKYGADADGSGSDSEDESDAPPEVSEEVEEQFLKTLALLKTKDPRIYDPNYKCFNIDEEKKKEEQTKPKTLTFDDSDDDDDDDGDIFKIEKKAEIDDTPKESPKKNKKEKKITDFLTGKAEHIDKEVEKDLAPLKALWSDPKISEGEAFLRDYILNKRYLEDDRGGEEERLRDDCALEADDEIVEEQSRFERAYNFRFEEPDDEFLKRFPRTVSSTRPKDDRRARQRAELRARKQQDKRRKMDEIARLKALKLKDIQEKIAKIKEVTGNDDLAFKEEDIEGDFDPEEHDRRMKALFDEQYYEEADDRKPVFPDLDEELEIENWDKYDEEAAAHQQDADEPHCEDEEFNMDADYDPNKPRAGLLEEIQKTLGKKRRNRKRKSKLAEILTVEKPKFVPDAEKTYAQYMEEYYKLDCEDIIGGDLPTRFKYREVVPNDYGLTIEEILLADDKELTQWVPLKKVVRLRPERLERGEVSAYRQRAADARLKRKALPSLFRDLPEEPELVVPVEKGSKKKKKKKNKEKSEETDAVVERNEINGRHSAVVTTADGGTTENETKIKKKRKKQSSEENVESSLTPDEINTTEIEINVENISNEIKSKKKKKKQSRGDSVQSSTNRDEINTSNNEESAENVANEVQRSEVKKRNKKKHKLHDETNNVDTPDVNSKVIKANSDQTDVSVEEGKNNKKKKQHLNEFTIESVPKQEPSHESSQANTRPPGNKLKRKLGEPSYSVVPRKKKNKGNVPSSKNNHKINKKPKQKHKFNNKYKSKNNNSNDKSNANPLAKLSDERLKAYGLNPKKYRSFLKYKKF